MQEPPFRAVLFLWGICRDCFAKNQLNCTLIEKAISINHKSQEKPVTMQVTGFFFASVIFKKCPQLIENKLRM